MRSEWKSVRAGDFIEFNPRLSIKKGEVATKISMDKLKPFTKRIPETEKVTFAGGTKFCNGDTIMARITPCLENGKTAFVDCLQDGEVGFGSTEFIVLRARDGISDPQFVYYLATSPIFRDIAIKSMVGTSGRQRVQQGVLENLMLDVPPLTEQQEIGSFLASLDAKIALNNKINENLEQQGSALIEYYMRGTETVASFADIMDFVSGFAFQSKTYLPSGKYQIITIKNVQDGYIDPSGAAFIDNLPLQMKTQCILHIGDVLLSLTGNVGRVGIVCETNLLLNQRVAKIVPKDKTLVPFLYFVYRQPEIKTQMTAIAKGTAQLNLSPVETLNLTIPYEKKSAVELSQMLTPLYQMIISNTQENVELTMLRNAVLPKLMSGKIKL